MNRRDLFRFAGLATVAAVIPIAPVAASGFLTDQQKRRLLAIASRDHDCLVVVWVRGRAEHFWMNHRCAIWFAHETHRLNGYGVEVIGGTAEGVILELQIRGT